MSIRPPCWTSVVPHGLFMSMSSIPTTTNKILCANPPEAHPPATSDANVVSQKEDAEEESIPDIECAPVNDDPRKWSHIRKACGHLK